MRNQPQPAISILEFNKLVDEGMNSLKTKLSLALGKEVGMAIVIFPLGQNGAIEGSTFASTFPINGQTVMPLLQTLIHRTVLGEIQAMNGNRQVAPAVIQ